MAKKRAEAERTTTATSLRLTPRCHAELDEMASQFDMSKTSMVEAAVHLLHDTLSRASEKAARRAIEDAKKIPN